MRPESLQRSRGVHPLVGLDRALFAGRVGGEVGGLQAVADGARGFAFGGHVELELGFETAVRLEVFCCGDLEIADRELLAEEHRPRGSAGAVDFVVAAAQQRVRVGAFIGRLSGKRRLPHAEDFTRRSAQITKEKCERE
jgi:hypothetical protein